MSNEIEKVEVDCACYIDGHCAMEEPEYSVPCPENLEECPYYVKQF